MEALFRHHWKSRSGAISSTVLGDRRNVILVPLLHHFGLAVALLFLQIGGQRRRCRPHLPCATNTAWKSTILAPFQVIKKDAVLALFLVDDVVQAPLQWHLAMGNHCSGDGGGVSPPVSFEDTFGTVPRVRRLQTRLYKIR